MADSDVPDEDEAVLGLFLFLELPFCFLLSYASISKVVMSPLDLGEGVDLPLLLSSLWEIRGMALLLCRLQVPRGLGNSYSRG